MGKLISALRKFECDRVHMKRGSSKLPVKTYSAGFSSRLRSMAHRVGARKNTVECSSKPYNSFII